MNIFSSSESCYCSIFSFKWPGNIPCVVVLTFASGISHGDSISVLEFSTKGKRLENTTTIFFREIEFQTRRHHVSQDEQTTTTHADVDDCSVDQYTDREVDDSPGESSYRASQLKALIESEIRDCISANDNGQIGMQLSLKVSSYQPTSTASTS